jgi:hypothetical protein
MELMAIFGRGQQQHTRTAHTHTHTTKNEERATKNEEREEEKKMYFGKMCKNYAFSPGFFPQSCKDSCTFVRDIFWNLSSGGVEHDVAGKCAKIFARKKVQFWGFSHGI